MDRRGRDLMVVWFTPTYAISAYHNYSLQHYVIKFVSHLQQVGDLLRVLRFPPSNKTDSHNITEIFIFESGVKHHNSNPFMCMFMNHLNYSSYNSRIGVVKVSVFASSAVDRGFETGLVKLL